MSFSPVGDIAQNLMLRRQGVTLRNELSSLALELASGRTRDLSSQLRGNFSTISAVEHSLSMQDGFDANRKSMNNLVEAAQFSLGAIGDVIGETGPTLLAGTATGDPVQIKAVMARGKDMLTDIVSFANTSHAGRYVFSGNSYDTAPLESADKIMSDVRAAVGGALNAADFSSSLDDFFSAPAGGFYATNYQGGDPTTGSTEISKSMSVDFKVTAKDDAIADAIKNSVMIALVGEGSFPGTVEERNATLRVAAAGLMETNSKLISAQADLGQTQERLENARLQGQAERQLYQTMKNDIVSVDPFKVATELEAVQTQLESLYLVTARTSRLKLSEFLR